MTHSAENELTWSTARDGLPFHTVTARTLDDGFILSTGFSKPFQASWSAVDRAETGAGSESLNHSAALSLVESNGGNGPDRFYFGGPWVRISTSQESVRFSHPDPEAFLELVRQHSPGVLIGAQALETPAAPSSQGFSPPTTWGGGRSADSVETRS